ncbi:MAG: response regulator transcription factor [Gammaproteobacteria bacterium]|nr:response regulator transcription factor [Gammaproteobacteria bacterium]
MPKILLVEDDPILARGLEVILKLEGYQIMLVNNLREASEIDERKILITILDINLPDGSGFDFLKKIRATGSKLPIIILTAKTDEDSIVYGLQQGANDYIRKPFGNRELIARIKVVLKDFSLPEKNLDYGDLQLFPDQREARYQGVKMDISRREFDILRHFMERAGVIVTRDSLLKNINREGEIFDRTIDSHVSHLRSSLRKSGINDIKISSVYGIGYRLEKT